MTERNETISPLRQRMLEDMRLRKLSPNTQTIYIRELKRSAAFVAYCCQQTAMARHSLIPVR
jgi:integrase/recombinase XerD